MLIAADDPIAREVAHQCLSFVRHRQSKTCGTGAARGQGRAGALTCCCNAPITWDGIHPCPVVPQTIESMRDWGDTRIAADDLELAEEQAQDEFAPHFSEVRILRPAPFSCPSPSSL